MLLQDLAEASEVECLVVLQQDKAQVEFTECQLKVMQLADVGGHRRVTFVLEHAIDILSSVAQPTGTGVTVVVVMGQEMLQLCFQAGVLAVGLRQLLCATKCLQG